MASAASGRTAFLALAGTLLARNPAAPVLPTPTGPFTVGTTAVFLVDSSRRDPIAHDRFGGRAVPVQLWYPASTGANGARAPYLLEPGLRPAFLSQGYYGIDSALIASWNDVDTHAFLGVGVARGRHALVMLVGGLGVARAHYTAFAVELASHGYIVAVADLPYEGFAVLPGGVTATAGDDSANSLDDAAVQRRQAAGWAADLSFVLNRLQHGSLTGVSADVADAIDWSRVGAFGHSSGGLIAVEACNHDPRIRACVNLDGGPLDPHGQPIADFVRAGLARPTLFLLEQPVYSDSDLARRHLTRAQFEARGRGFPEMLDSLARRGPGPLLVARITGTGHMSFSDAPFVMPATITRFGGRIIEARRGFEIIAVTVRTFFDGALANGDVRSVTALPTRYPELGFTEPDGRSDFTGGARSEP